MQLSDLRLALAEARIALRQTKDAYEVSRAVAEIAAAERLNGNLGRNEAERQRNLTIELLDDDGYSNVLVLLRDAEAKVDRLAAEIAAHEDAIRANEARIREKLADALMGKRPDDAAADVDWYDVAMRAEQRKYDAIEEQYNKTHVIKPNYDDPVFPAGSNAGGEYPR